MRIRGFILTVICFVFLGTSLCFADDVSYRDVLSKGNQEIYDCINEIIKVKGTDTLYPKYNITFEELNAIHECVMADHPEYYWCCGDMLGIINRRSRNVISASFEYLDFNDTEAYQSKIQEYVKDVVATDSFDDKVWKIYWNIRKNANFDGYNINAGQSAYSVLMNNKGVCAGYSRAFQKCCKAVGINMYYMRGKADTTEHAWNMAIDENGLCHYYDITWDDNKDDMMHYNMPAEVFAKDRVNSKYTEDLVKMLMNQGGQNASY